VNDAADLTRLRVLGSLWGLPDGALADYAACLTRIGVYGPGLGRREPLGLGRVYTAKLYRVDPSSGNVEFNLTIDVIYPTGLAFDGACLWVSDIYYSRIFRINATTGEVLSNMTKASVTGMDWDSGYLWLSVAESIEVQKVDPVTGGTVETYYSPSSSPSGIAWGGGHLWIGDVGNGKVYKTSPYAQQYAEYGRKPPSYFWLLFFIALFPVLLTFLSKR